MFKKYFKLPLQFSYGFTKVSTDDNNMAFDFVSSWLKIENGFNLTDSQKGLIVEIINGEDFKLPKELSFTIDGEANVHLLQNGKDKGIILFIRSWGRLTGTGGGLGLSEDKAIEIQDSFGEYIIEKLNKSSNG